MGETIYSIPINETFDAKCGCPLCALHSQQEKSSLEYILGPAMMEPDIRLETNRLGFCGRHGNMLLAMKNRLPLALTLQTRLRAVRELLAAPGEGGRALFGKKSAQEDPLFSCADDCFICRRISAFDERIISNTVYLWQSDTDFREKFRQQQFFCLGHASSLLRCASVTFSKQKYVDFRADVTELCLRYADALDASLTGFIDSFDHKNASVPLPDKQRRCAEDAIAFLSPEDE